MESFLDVTMKSELGTLAVSHNSLKLLNLATSQVFFSRIVKECPEKFHLITSKKLFLKKSREGAWYKSYS